MQNGGPPLLAPTVSRIRNFRTWHNSILFSLGPRRRDAFLTLTSRTIVARQRVSIPLDLSQTKRQIHLLLCEPS